MARDPGLGGGGDLGVYRTSSMYLELSLALPPILQMMKLKPRKDKGGKIKEQVRVTEQDS